MRGKNLGRATLVLLASLFVTVFGLIGPASADYVVCATVSYNLAGQSDSEKQCLLWTEYERQETVGPTCAGFEDEFVCATVYDSYPPP